MARALIVSGGVGHPFAETSARLAELLAEEGIESETTEDIEAAFTGLGDGDLPDMVVVNALRWRMLADRYAPLRDEWAFHLGPQAREGLAGFLASGGGLLGIHTASICFDDWPEWGRILGGRWNWDRSSHPPPGPASVRLRSGDGIVAGLADFETFDEIYGFLDVEPDVDPLMVSAHGGTDHPVLWRRYYGSSRVAYSALGHDLRAYDAVPHVTALRRVARWVGGVDGTA